MCEGIFKGKKFPFKASSYSQFVFSNGTPEEGAVRQFIDGLVFSGYTSRKSKVVTAPSAVKAYSC